MPYALAIGNATAPSALIAVGGAGALGFFTDRPIVDLLGKSDPVIAHEKPKRHFLPGHNKWDYAYSIRKLRPDLVTDVGETASDAASIESWGYLQLTPGTFVRADSRVVDRTAVAAAAKQYDALARG